MEGDAKQRNQRNRRRERAARMQKQKAEGRAADQGSGEEGDESPARQKQRPPTRKKRIKVGKEPLFEEDVIDGFAILSFRTYEELENTMKSLEKRSSPVEFVLDAKMDKLTTTPFTNHKQRHHKQAPTLLNNNNNNNNEEGGGGVTSDENCKPAVIEEVNGPLLNNNNNNSARYRLSDVSSHSSSGRGYMCDSESNDDRGSDTDLFRTTNVKREVSSSGSAPANGRTSPLLLLPSLAPIQNGPTEQPTAGCTVPTTTTASGPTTTSILASVCSNKTPSPAPPLFSPPPPPFLAEGPPVVKGPPSPHLPTVHHFSNGPAALFSPLSPRPQPFSRSSPLLSTSPSIPPISSSNNSSSSVGSKGIVGIPGLVGLPPCSTTSVITHARPSPSVVAASPATTPSRDSHSSSSSISSLSQLSQSLHIPRESSRSSSRNNTPSCCGALTSLVFSKPSWSSPTGAINGPHLTTPPPARPTPPPTNSLGLPLHNHTGHFGGHPAPPAPSLHASGPHPGMFPPPIALSSPSLSLANPGAPAPFADPIFSQPNQDLLRRELDTRFLASQDRSINIPPPPYMRAEMHQHTHMHQHSPFLLGNAMVPQPNPHMYDKFPKLEPPSFYGRNTLGLPSYPGLTPLLGPAGTAPGPAPTPFTPAGQLAAFQPKKHLNLMPRTRLDTVVPENMSSLVKSKNLKSGRWCAMHVRIAWEIYHHQQKQQQQQQQQQQHQQQAVEAHKSGGPGAGKSPADLLRPPGHLFSALPRPHELPPPLSSSLLAATASSHSRTFEASQHHNSFLNPNPAHLGVSHFARPAYPGFGGPGSSFAGLSTLGLAGPGLFGNRDLGGAACLSGLGSAQDPLYRLHRTAPPTFGAPSSSGPPPPPSGASWGGLKAEADRERLHREEQEKQRKAEQMERREKEQQLDRERREQERQKERDRENRVFHHHHHHHHIQESLRNGELMTEQQRPPREWERPPRVHHERRETSRSPLGGRKTNAETGSSSAFESSKPTEVIKVKEEKKDIEEVMVTSNHVTERTAPPPPRQHEQPNDFLARTLGTPVSLAMSLGTHRNMLNSLAASERLPPPHGFWGNLPTSNSAADPFRNLEFHQAAREQMLQRYGPLVPMSAHDRFREAEFARHMAASDSFAFDRSKLPPPPLRPNDGPYPGSAGGLVGAPPPGSIFPSLPPHLPGLGSSRSKNSSGSPSATIPPPLIPCTGGVQNHVTPGQSPTLHKLGLVGDNHPHEPYFAKERRELALHPSELDAQSR